MALIPCASTPCFVYDTGMSTIRTTTKPAANRRSGAKSTRPRPDASWLFTSTDPEAVAWRREQGQVDADIEGLASDAGAEALAREMDAAGLEDVDERIERLKAYFQAQERNGVADG